MSATLDTQLFLNYFGGVPLHIPGRQHHVTVLYAREPQPDIMDSAMITVLQVRPPRHPAPTPVDHESRACDGVSVVIRST